MSTSKGDSVVNSIGVIDEPSVLHFQLNASHKYLILTTDGVSDGLSIPELVQIAGQHGSDLEKLSQEITRLSLIGLDKREIDDNTTNIVICFEHGNE